jgi:hypothetical protein
MGPEASSEYFNIGSTIQSLNSSNVSQHWAEYWEELLAVEFG